MSGIYEIKNNINGKSYVGSAKDIKRRWRRHKYGLRHNEHENIILQRAWNKYGEENFSFNILEECSIEMLLALEQKYLNLKPEYNIGMNASGGDNLTNNPNRNTIISNIKQTLNNTIEKMSDTERKLKYSRPMENNPNWKNGCSYNYCVCGKQIKSNSKHCNKCRPRSLNNNPFYNKKHSEEFKKIMSEERKGKYIGNQNIRFTIDDVEYFSLGDASIKLGIPIPTISWRLKSKNEKFKNYKYI